jgi:hypothetical protein
MGIIVKDGGSDYTPAPAGMHAARCCDVVDLGDEETPWGVKAKVRISWLINARMADERPYMVSRKYTQSLHEKSNLRRDLEGWRGVPFSAEDLEGFDLEKLIGATCVLQLVHNENGGKTYANVQTITPCRVGDIAPELDGYVRVQDRNRGPEDKTDHGDLPF